VSNAASIVSRRRAALTRRAIALLAHDPPAPIGDIDALLTDACAAVLALEGRCVRMEDSRLAAELEYLRELIAELTAGRRAYERAAQTSPRRTA
jgi:hypothetical protein